MSAPPPPLSPTENASFKVYAKVVLQFAELNKNTSGDKRGSHFHELYSEKSQYGLKSNKKSFNYLLYIIICVRYFDLLASR